MSISCIVVTPRAEDLGDFITGLTRSGEVKVEVVGDGAQALATMEKSEVGLAVIDEGLPDIEPLPLVMQLIMTNALVNTAVISSLSSEEFHEKSEGFGVLCALKPQPSSEEGEQLAKQVVRIVGAQ